MPLIPDNYRSSGETVPVEVFLPKGSGRVRSVLIIHGSSGLGVQYRADIVSFAEACVARGIGACCRTISHRRS